MAGYGGEERGDGADGPRVVVVGPCASGKTTLVQGLRELGYDARVCAQEHSGIPGLWRRSLPAAIVALDVDIATLRSRRDAQWSELLLERQHARLADAFAVATVRIDTSHVSSTNVLARATQALRATGILPGRNKSNAHN